MNNTRAIVWEMALYDSGTVNGVRLMVSGSTLAVQELRQTTQRPRWRVEHYDSVQDAIAMAQAYTQKAEEEHKATMTVNPVEVMVHPAEYDRLQPGVPIPPSLRARLFTALYRKKREGVS